MRRSLLTIFWTVSKQAHCLLILAIIRSLIGRDTKKNYLQTTLGRFMTVYMNLKSFKKPRKNLNMILKTQIKTTITLMETKTYQKTLRSESTGKVSNMVR
jgi:hypothetical protein